MTFRHPGKLYLELHGSIQSADGVYEYADFLRDEAGQSGVIPVDLNVIFSHFEIPKPKYVPLPGQQGLLVDGDHGIIAINSGDPDTRQRFTEAHELVELLFSVLPQGPDLGSGWYLERPGGFKKRTKEYLCNQTAANLIMPPPALQPHIEQFGVSFEGAHRIAEDCWVSLSAALVQLANLGPGRHSVVLWRMKHKPTEIKNHPGSNQLSLFDDDDRKMPRRKLRVEWTFHSDNGPFIPKHKSTNPASNIFSAWETGLFTHGKEMMTFDNRHSGWYRSENFPFEFNDERYVLSLIEYLHR